MQTGNPVPYRRYKTKERSEHLRFHPNGHQLVTGDIEGFISLWNLNRSKPFMRWRAQKTIIQTIELSLDGNWLISSGNTMKLWKWGSKQPYTEKG